MLGSGRPVLCAAHFVAHQLNLAFQFACTTVRNRDSVPQPQAASTTCGGPNRGDHRASSMHVWSVTYDHHGAVCVVYDRVCNRPQFHPREATPTMRSDDQELR